MLQAIVTHLPSLLNYCEKPFALSTDSDLPYYASRTENTSKYLSINYIATLTCMGELFFPTGFTQAFYCLNDF